ncbi:MAG: heavy metal translocating P-type ATPase [Burkholderiales bacterium]|nr:heavy metal translocating P-type ATPase [Burkholderiales bacterium]
MTSKPPCCGHDDAACTTSTQHQHEPATQAPADASTCDTQTLKLRIDNMDCPTEEALIRRALSGIEGVAALDFDLINRILTVHHQLDDVQPIHRLLQQIGMRGMELRVTTSTTTALAPAVTKTQLARVLIGGLAAIGAEAWVWHSDAGLSWPVALLTLLAIFSSGLPTLKKGWIALRHLTLNIHLLMTAAVLGALAIGQWPEAAMVIWLFAIAEMIEAASLARARDVISGLRSQAPETAWLLQADSSWAATDTHSIHIGQTIQVRPGDRIALDGIVETGSSSVNQAAITGESMPVEKNLGDQVYAGTLNQSGVLQVRVTATQDSTMLARIALSVQDAQSKRAPMQRLVDKFAAVYTPTVFVFALLMAILPPLLGQHAWRDSLYQALVLLVIACPCALVISTPVTVVSGLALAARRGIVVKGGLYLEQGKQLRLIALDKTGTLTEGKPRLNGIVSLSELSPEQLLHIAASLDAHSSHPLAQALLTACQTSLLPVNDLALLSDGRGRGVHGNLAGHRYQLGNRAMLDALQQQSPGSTAQPDFESELQRLEAQANTVMFLCREGRLLGLLAVADQVRSSSREAVAQLHALQVRTVMLTGDNPHTAQAIAAQTGITEIRSHLLPDDKLTAIQEFVQQGVTGMCGDGINDAPALACANIGFAMAAGSDTALETADVALMQNDLRKIPEFIRISRHTSRLLWQNIGFALAIKFLFFGLALGGYASLWMAVFADTGTSLLVVLNGLRVLAYVDPSD